MVLKTVNGMMCALFFFELFNDKKGNSKEQHGNAPNIKKLYVVQFVSISFL